MKKVISLVLAVLMCCTVFPLAAFAEDTTDDTVSEEISATAEETVAAWEANYAVLLDTLMNGENYAHYQYVIDNNEDIQNTMAVYTAFGLYDNSWKNYFTQEVNIDTCKQILMAMIEEYTYEMSNSYVDSIVEALQYASDAADFIEKLNGYVSDYSDVLDFVSSQEWSTVFQVVDVLIEVGQTWQNIRSGLIEAYSQIMSVQLANGYYIEMLEYVAENTTYEPMQEAALELIDEATTAIEEQIALFLETATEDLANNGIDYLVSLALNSNVYTATAQKVWSISTSVADALWNTSDQYTLYDALIASYYAETAINEYAVLAFDDAAENYDAARTMFATYALISVRSFGEESLYNLLDAQSGGIINKIKSKLYNTSCTEYTANMAALSLTEEALFNTDVADMAPVEAIAYIYCPVNVLVYDGSTLLYRVKDGEESTYTSSLGMAQSSYCAYNDEYIKVVFLGSADEKIVLIATDDGYVTFVKDVMEDGVVNDYSFTELAVTPGTKITIEGTTYAVTAEETTTEYELSEEFVQPEGKEVTWETVAEATKEVVVEETTSLIEKIKAFFQNLIAQLKALFSIG
ncbi:MAG: hypothetical protein LUG85_00405 [Clostridiales bacterium]|nr:hypothetical protein [Clostridiales bacterium]